MFIPKASQPELDSARDELKVLDETLNLFLVIGRKIRKIETCWNKKKSQNRVKRGK